MSDPRTVLIVGIAPDAVDVSDPDLPADMTADKIAAGLADAQKQFADAGDHADLCMIQPDDSAEATIGAHLSRSTYDCIVIGGGIRVPTANLPLFERVINAVHRLAPDALIAFNAEPQDSRAAAERVGLHD